MIKYLFFFILIALSSLSYSLEIENIHGVWLEYRSGIRQNGYKILIIDSNEMGEYRHIDMYLNFMSRNPVIYTNEYICINTSRSINERYKYEFTDDVYELTGNILVLTPENISEIDPIFWRDHILEFKKIAGIDDIKNNTNLINIFGEWINGNINTYYFGDLNYFRIIFDENIGLINENSFQNFINTTKNNMFENDGYLLNTNNNRIRRYTYKMERDYLLVTVNIINIDTFITEDDEIGMWFIFHRRNSNFNPYLSFLFLK
jgi:hypothetical protein